MNIRVSGAGVLALAVGLKTRPFSTLPVNMETSSPPHGPPRGLINRLVSLGLPPWAAWCRNLDSYAMYRMTNVKPRRLRPKPPYELDEIWDEEHVQERVRSSGTFHYVYRQLKYPHVKYGIWHSDALDHWVQVPMVDRAYYMIEKEGGFDNYILNRPGERLTSSYGERIRRHILVRQKEIQKNFILQKQVEHLSSAIMDELRAAKNMDVVNEIVEKYSLSPNFLKKIREQVSSTTAP